MDVSEAKRLRELQHENILLKKIVAEQALDIRMLKDVNSRKWGIVSLTISDPHKQSPVASLKLSSHELGARHHLPFAKCPRAKLAIVNRSYQVPCQP